MNTPEEPTGGEISTPARLDDIGAQLKAAGWSEVHAPSYIHDYFDRVDNDTAPAPVPAAPAEPTLEGYDKALPSFGDPIGLGTLQPDGTFQRDGSFVKGEMEIETVTLDHDLWLVQYYDRSFSLDKGERSLCYWQQIEPATAIDLGTKDAVEHATEDTALLDSWGQRNAVQIAVIPSGTEVNFAAGTTVPQAEDKLAKAIQTGDLGSAYPDDVLEAIWDTKLGGAPQLAFVQFDENWVRFSKDIAPHAASSDVDRASIADGMPARIDDGPADLNSSGPAADLDVHSPG